MLLWVPKFTRYQVSKSNNVIVPSLDHIVDKRFALQIFFYEAFEGVEILRDNFLAKDIHFF